MRHRQAGIRIRNEAKGDKVGAACPRDTTYLVHALVVIKEGKVNRQDHNVRLGVRLRMVHKLAHREWICAVLSTMELSVRLTGGQGRRKA